MQYVFEFGCYEKTPKGKRRFSNRRLHFPNLLDFFSLYDVLEDSYAELLHLFGDERTYVRIYQLPTFQVFPHIRKGMMKFFMCEFRRTSEGYWVITK